MYITYVVLRLLNALSHRVDALQISIIIIIIIMHKTAEDLAYEVCPMLKSRYQLHHTFSTPAQKLFSERFGRRFSPNQFSPNHFFLNALGEDFLQIIDLIAHPVKVLVYKQFQSNNRGGPSQT